MNRITCRDLCISYNGYLAVDHVSFSLDAGEYLCIVGENGSGKEHFGQRVVGAGQAPGRKHHIFRHKRTEIGYLPQQTVVQKDFPATVFEVVLSGCLNSRGLRPFYSKKEKESAMAQLRLLNMEELCKKSYRDLSGGQQQRVLLARALCATKQLLLLDEPVTGLDPVVITSELYSLVKRLNQEQKITVIMVSHDIASAINYADKNSSHGSGGSLFWHDSRLYGYGAVPSHEGGMRAWLSFLRISFLPFFKPRAFSRRSRFLLRARCWE